jgi:hypothetical protein
MSAWSGLRALFGAPKPKKAGVRRPRQKTVLPPSERAALLKEALAAHRAGRSHVRDVLEGQLQALRAKVPNPNRDPDATARLLTLTHADGALKQLMTHDLKRFLVLVGIRQLLDEKQKPADRPRSVLKR